MKTTEIIVQDFLDLKTSQAVYLARALSSMQYDFVCVDLSSRNTPVGINDFYKKKTSYIFLLDDENASAKFVQLRFAGASGTILIPIGVFGLSPKNKLRFPLILNLFCLSFLKLNKQEFASLISEESSEAGLSNAYESLRHIRNNFIMNIFRFYASLDEGLDSIMGWEIRDKNSSTRKIAQETNFIRSEIKNTNSEFYSLQQLNESQLNYLIGCSFRSEYGMVNNKEKPDGLLKKIISSANLLKGHRADNLIKVFYTELVAPNVPSLI